MGEAPALPRLSLVALPFVNMPEQLSELRKTRVLNAAAAKSRQSCPTLRPHRRQPTRLLCPWDSPGKNPGVGCHFLLQCMKVKSEREVAQSCPTLSDPVDYSLPGSSTHATFQARVLEWGAIAFSGITPHVLTNHCVFICPRLLAYVPS